jgi:hypothetical protein
MEAPLVEKTPIPILSHENHRDWFQDMYFLLERKEAAEAVEQTPTTTPTSESSNQLETSQHAPAKRKQNAECMYWIRKCINQDDKYLIDNEKRAWKVWAMLK